MKIENWKILIFDNSSENIRVDIFFFNWINMLCCPSPLFHNRHCNTTGKTHNQTGIDIQQHHIGNEEADGCCSKMLPAPTKNLSTSSSSNKENAWLEYLKTVSSTSCHFWVFPYLAVDNIPLSNIVILRRFLLDDGDLAWLWMQDFTDKHYHHLSICHIYLHMWLSLCNTCLWD